MDLQNLGPMSDDAPGGCDTTLAREYAYRVPRRTESRAPAVTPIGTAAAFYGGDYLP